MQIVIDISDTMYKRIKDMETLIRKNPIYKSLELAVLNGIPLPIIHGRLIDVDGLELDDNWSDYEDGYTAYSQCQINNTPTVLERTNGNNEVDE